MHTVTGRYPFKESGSVPLRSWVCKQWVGPIKEVGVQPARQGGCGPGCMARLWVAKAAQDRQARVGSHLEAKEKAGPKGPNSW